ncbi:hypothetical protein LR48_Vigan04g020800 [Vigna angularis]|uniref:Bifunctional inhibitor/plant lipid transfer protein/seed storage helical domain-containing protein n=2 Tax=Phaseolus angularis TaxID=3914 RepID=A0A0L9UAS6_PHAAN|nr:uncharacterized protein HKW66_Vig0087550 [Vigna angularis]KOM40010.1 hypothetical protein LR48_Vigan04g020800 [Vigna angularis]
MGWMKYVFPVFLSLSLLSVVRSERPPPCPSAINTTGLYSACVSLLRAVESSSCCSVLQGLSPDQAVSCVGDALPRIVPYTFKAGQALSRLVKVTGNACGLTNV